MTRYLAALFGPMGVACLAILGVACGRSDILDYSTDFDGGPGSDGAPGTDGGPGFDAPPPTGCTSGAECASLRATPYCELPEGVCVACLTSPDTCPAGLTCAPQNHQCVRGACPTDACTAGDTCCGSVCVDTADDLGNCGGCGEQCAAGYTTCMSGACCFPINGGVVCTNPTCVAPRQTCNDACVDESTDPNNCGECGNGCGSGATCEEGRCTPLANCNGGPACTGTAQCCSGGCSDTTSDPENCGACEDACPMGATCAGGVCSQQPPCNGGPACTGVETCCPSGCISLESDASNCGTCGNVCSSGATCIDGSCVVNQGGFDPIVNPTFLSPGPHSFTTINIPAGVTVYVAGGDPGSGTLDLEASGDVVIDGTIDLSGAPGTENTITSQSTDTGRAGSGGFTGEPYASAPESSACEFIAGNPGSLGFALAGTPGTCPVLSTTTCVSMTGPNAILFTAPVAQYGGGAGIFTGFRAYGSGGGGPAGGAPGALGLPFPGEQDCSGVSGGGGAVDGAGGMGGTASPYAGGAGISGQTQCPGQSAQIPPAYVGGGGGGSIGARAASDLAVLATFQTGSGGGGGSADYLDRPVFGGTSGGGGGGGALKLSSQTSITIHGELLANGGAGGDAGIGNGANANCDPQPGAGGGGGAGGVIYLSAPVIAVGAAASVSVAGGAGGAQSEFATGGGGGAGGIGRIRLSVTPATCSLMGSFTPGLASACTPTSTPGAVYVGLYPN